MISIFRRLIGSKFGAFLALLFLAMVAFAFVAGDISSGGGGMNFSFLNGSGAARAGGSVLTEDELQSRVQRTFEQQRRQQPGLPFSALLEEDGVNQIYNQLVASMAVAEFAKNQGVFISKRMVDAQIASIPAFQDASGKFNQNVFRQLLSGQGISEKALREDFSKDIYSRLMLAPAGMSVRLPDSLVLPYASLLLETRQGRVAAVPSAAFISKTEPTDAQINDFYKRNAARYMLPEQRKLRYAVVDAARFAAVSTPTDAEVAAAYAKDKAKYAAREIRSIEQLILPTEAAAKAAMGKSLADAAKAAGLSIATFGPLSQADLAKQASDDIAKAAYATAQGQITGPVRSGLGWAVIRVTAVKKIPEVTLPQAREEIVKALSVQKQAQLLSDFTSKLEDQASNGATFDEVVKNNGLKIEVTPLLITNGQVVDDPNYKPSADVAALLKAGFTMEADDEPQLAQLGAQGRYALLDVDEVVAAAPAPLAKIRAIVVEQYKLHEALAKARTLADSLQAKVAKGMPLEQALAQAGIPLPPAQKVGGRRADLMRGGNRPPTEIALLFAMPKGSVKVLPIGQDRGYFLVQLENIAQGDAAKVPGLVDRLRGDLTQVVAGELSAQLEQAIERDLGVKRDPQAVVRVTQELSRINGGGAQ